MKKINISLAIAALFLAGACGNAGSEHHHDEEAATEHHHHDGEEEHANEIVFEPAKARAAGIEVQTVEPGSFVQVIRTGGQLLAAQGEETVAVAPQSGVVSYGSRLSEGMKVGAGSRLFVVSASGLADGDPVEKARAAYETARGEYERVLPLAESQIVSQKELARTKLEYDNARIAYEALSANHSEQGLAVVSPIEAYVKSLLVKEGDYVSQGQPLASLTRSRRLQLRADVSQRYYNQLSSVSSARFSTPYSDKVYDLASMNGKLLSYGRSTDDNHYVSVSFELDNVGDVVPGSMVEVFLLTTPLEHVIALPREAITEEQGSYFVYTQIDEEGYLKLPVTIGPDNGEEVLIVDGVTAGQRIVVRGANQLKLASASHAIPAHTHSH